MKRNAVTLLLRVSKELEIRKRAWKKVQKFLRENEIAGITTDARYYLKNKMTEILKAERRER